jgi:hypothetical protein
MRSELAIRLALAVVSIGLTAATAACGSEKSGKPPPASPAPGFNLTGSLQSVTAASRDAAWAVGYSGAGSDIHTLMIHWDGRTWTRVSSPSPVDGRPGIISGVSAASPSDAWAVGSLLTGKTSSALLLHWNGSGWREIDPPRRLDSVLYGVTVSPHGAWAVGSSIDGGKQQPLILRLDASGWHPVPAPSARAAAFLMKVTAAPDGTAWALGMQAPKQGSQIPGPPVLMRWTGSRWMWTRLPLAGANHQLVDMATGRDGTTWVVGSTGVLSDHPPSVTDSGPAVVMRWTGARWLVAQVANIGGGTLAGVAVGPDGTPWAVGSTLTNAIVVRLDGDTWTTVPLPRGVGGPTGHDGLTSVAFASTGDGWAVGDRPLKAKNARHPATEPATDPALERHRLD